MKPWRLVATVITCLGLVAATAAPAAARERDRDEARGLYLALGNSVAFGYNPLLDRRNAANFVGYPEALASRLELSVTNASCPGETSSGFISLTGVDNSCRPYRAAFPLHANYNTSQLDFAVAFLRAHPATRLVTIDIGANDLFVLQRNCKGDATCIQSGLPALLATLASNLSTIYTRLRQSGHYHHQIIALTYYATNYNDPTSVMALQAINQTIARVTLAAHGTVADGFEAFRTVAARYGGDSCAAGLLIVLSANPRTCDIHPSPLGHNVLAGAIARALRADAEDRADRQSTRAAAA